MPADGLVTNLKIGCNESVDSIGSRTDCYRLLPLTKSVVSMFAMLRCSDHMASGIDGVINGGVD